MMGTARVKRLGSISMEGCAAWFRAQKREGHQGRAEEARDLIRQAIDLDPLDERYYQWLGEIDYSLGRLPDAEANFRKALDINPALAVDGPLAEVQLAEGHAAAALETLQQQHPQEEPSRARDLALVYFALGRESEAKAGLSRLEERDANDSALSIAQIHAYRRELDQAFDWLDRALVWRDPNCFYLKTDPLLNNLRGDGRYKALLLKTGLP